ncbi:hypothetical protein EV130_101382 [Rhizobium azibense]|uniref:DNA-binding CsgD family transcriptional regulator n=1 Tax=Rhizobium azibense TaxID=1136135 RepID=A0A4R3R9G5_9HYPH|nr:hypothetical protein EV130_101382 [Rhizobium azibense]TCU41174.1 hypothetical protein EV129_101461 [Rhizobium azibense]
MKDLMLSPREKACISWMGHGKSVGEIAILQGKSGWEIEEHLVRARIKDLLQRGITYADWVLQLERQLGPELTDMVDSEASLSSDHVHPRMGFDTLRCGHCEKPGGLGLGNDFC